MTSSYLAYHAESRLINPLLLLIAMTINDQHYRLVESQSANDILDQAKP